MPVNVTTEQFYDALADDYSRAVTRCVPRYNEMLSSLFSYLPNGFAPVRILELGCGSGNLTLELCRRFPGICIDAIDLSGELLKIARARTNTVAVNFLKEDFRCLDLSAASYDLVISSISIHHLKDDEKKVLFNRVLSWLSVGGILTFSDQFRGATDHVYRMHIRRWKNEAFAAGLEQPEWDSWMEHQQQHDHHATMVQHFKWLQDAGFDSVDCTWRYLLWATIYAHKA